MTSESIVKKFENDSNFNRVKNEFKYPFDVRYNVVLGCPRSGTTFLMNSLKALPFPRN